MGDEYNTLIKSRTWDLVPHPPPINIVHSTWIFHHKFDAYGKVSRYKAQLVANGKSQQLGIDSDENFHLVVKSATIRVVLHVALAHDRSLRQLYMKNKFLHGNLQEMIYMHHPSGFLEKSKPDHVSLLRNSLYGFKQAFRAWYIRIASVTRYIDFTPSKLNPSIFVLGRGSNMAYLLLYNDDIALTASTPALFDRIISKLGEDLELMDLGKLHHLLGFAFTYTEGCLFLSQWNYGMNILDRAMMTECNPCHTSIDTKSKLDVEDNPPVADPSLYRSLAGALQYLMFTRPEISFVV